MPVKNHYKVLGLDDFAAGDKVKDRYRKLVRELHPDVNPAAHASERFREVTESYQLLTDPERRRSYDATLRMERQAKAPPPPKATPTPRQKPPTIPSNVKDQIAAAQRHFAAGRLRDAESEAKALIGKDSKLAVAYSILGDVYQSQNRLDRAAKMYALAVQHGPKEPVFQRRYEQILDRIERERALEKQTPGLKNPQRALGISLLVHPLLIGFAGFASDQPAHFLVNSMVNYWTPSLVLMLLLDGLLCGFLLSASGQVERWESLGRRGMVAGGIGAVSFWAASIYYGVTGVLQDAFTPSLSRVFTWCLCLLVAFTIAYSVQHPGWSQVAMWGGNLLLVGALCGWRLMDSLKG